MSYPMSTVTTAQLDSVKVLWRRPDTLTLYGIPYRTRPGQSPRDLWDADRDWHARYPGSPHPRIVEGWIYLGEPGWYGSLDAESIARIKARVERWQATDKVPQGPCEWDEV